MAGIVKAKKTAPAGGSRSFRRTGGDPVRRLDAWGPRVALILCAVLLTMAAWLLLHARPWAL